MINPAIYYLSSFQDSTNSSQTPLETPVMADLRVWDQLNLNVTTYRDGTPIPEVKTGWNTLKTGAWRYYNNNPASAVVYGRLYNWYAMMGIWQEESSIPTTEEILARKNIAPVGWEVATFGEWTTLRNSLGTRTAAVEMKESGPSHWGISNTADNSSYFTALPGGFKSSSNSTSFSYLGERGYWWPNFNEKVRFIIMTNSSNSLGYSITTPSKNLGVSIRLIKPTGVIPYFTTIYPAFINPNSFLGVGGDIPTDYSSAIIERGIVYGLSENPTISNTRIIDDGSGLGSYTLDMNELSSFTEYHIRAYVISSSIGITYANNLRVYTTDAKPILYTDNISQISTNSAISGGYIEHDGGFLILSKGVCWSTLINPTTNLTTKTNNGIGSEPFISEITGLSLNQTYYVRAYATNEYDTAYGEQIEFTTLTNPSPNLIFNQYLAHHAYSLRKLSDTYNYRCLRVRRQTTTVQGVASVTTTFADVLFNSSGTIGLDSDIIYTSGSVTLATTLGEFAASDGFENIDEVNVNQNIFINIWYDQSGNNLNVRNNGTTTQPRIVSNGILHLGANNKPGVRFSGGQILSLANSDVFYNNESVYVVGSANSLNTINFYSQGQANLNARIFIGRQGGIWYNNISTLVVPDFKLIYFTPNVPRLYELICGTFTTSAYSDGLQLNPPSIPSLTVTNATIKIGANSSPQIHSNGSVQEAICLVGTPSRESISPNIMDYYEIQKLPFVSTDDINHIENTRTAIGGGNVTDDFGLPVTSRGVCWNSLPNPSLDFGARTIDGQGVGSFISNIDFLSAYATYYVRAYAESSLGVSYGQQKEFTTGELPVESFILDLFPSAHHAYSLRKLRTQYTGACLRVRRTAGTSTEVNVSFDSNGTISFNSLISPASGAATNATTLGQFAEGTVDGLSAQSIFIVTWYDQSGNSKNSTQATAGNQPRLVYVDPTTGVATLELSGGKVAVRFTKSSGQYLSITDTTAYINNMSSYFVGQFVSNTAQQIGYSLSLTNRFFMPYLANTHVYAGYATSAQSVTYDSLSTVLTDRKLFELLAPSPLNQAVAQGWINGVARDTEALGTGNTTAIQLGTGGTNYFDGYIQEVIGWETNTYRAEKEININVYWTIY